MRKICVLLIIVLIFSSCVYGAINLSNALSLEFDGTKATCTASVTDYGSSISITMYLYRGSALVRSWSKSGTNAVVLSKEYNCISGQTYTLDADITVNGLPVNTIPVTKPCP